jgi:cyclic pyranopterin phosphate synthase
MDNPKITNDNQLRDWAKDIFKKNSFNMIDVSAKKETFRRALAAGEIFVGERVFNMINKN